MAGEIKDYIPARTADYGGLLDISPQGTMLEEGEFAQKILETDARTIHAITINDTPDFIVEIEMHTLSEEDVTAVYDFYFNPLKAKGRARTFYWKHPRDGEEYVVRFLDTLQRVTQYHRGFQTIRLKIEGYRN